MDTEKLEKLFAGIAEQHECYDDIKEDIRSLHSSDVISDDDYNYLLENWDNILRKFNL